MIQQMLNFVWAICVGKLMLNDIPHLLDNPGPRPGSMTARAIELWKGGYTYDQIARALGTSIGVVSVLLTRARKTYGEEIVPHRRRYGRREATISAEEVIDLYMKGLKTKDIAEELGISDEYVRQIVHKYRKTTWLPYRRGSKVEPYLSRDKAIVDMYKEGVPVKELAELAGVSESNIRRVLREEGSL